MELFADYHTHTIYSHGKGTIEDNVVAAIRRGLREIAITDHGPSHASYGVRRRNLPKMRMEIDRLQQKYPEIRILLGVEANLIGIDGTIDVGEQELKILDKLLLGFHNGAVPKSPAAGWNLYLMNYLANLKSKSALADVCRARNTDALIRAVQRYPVDILTHPGAKIDIDIRRLAKAVSGTKTVLEINASHGNLTVEYAKIALEEHARFVIDSDAHHPDRVGDFKRGIEIAQAAGIPADRIINAM